jgi:hypothetical protein
VFSPLILIFALSSVLETLDFSGLQRLVARSYWKIQVSSAVSAIRNMSGLSNNLAKMSESEQSSFSTFLTNKTT